MAKNKKLIIGLVVFAFCLCCAIFGLGFTSKNSIVAKADTIAEVATMSASAAEVKSIGIASNNSTEYNTVAEVYVEDEAEDTQTAIDDEDIDIEYEDEEDGSADSENFSVLRIYEYATFQGDVRWIDDDLKQHPLRGIKIQIGEYLTYTDDYGRYYLRELFILGDSVDIIAYAADWSKDYSKGYAENIRIVDNDGKMYSHVIKSNFIVSAENDVPSCQIQMYTNAGQAFQILQAVITARDFAQEMMGSMPSAVAVVYPSNVGICKYDKFSLKMHIISANGSANRPASYASWDVIMHEYGHHIQHAVGITDSPYGSHDPFKNHVDERENKSEGIKLAWGEAWPTVFGMIAQKYYFEKGLLHDIKTVGDSCYSAYNVNTYDINTIEFGLGEGCENSIIAVLWDLFDFDFEENDTIYLGYKGFWDITTKDQCKTFSEFIQVFYDTYPNLIDAIGANLSDYNMASSKLTVTAKSLTALPEFSWEGGGGSQKGFNNNYFDLVFYDSSNAEIFRISDLTTTSYTLSDDEVIQVSYLVGDTYWAVEAKNVYDVSTGPYISQKLQITAPVGVFTLGLNRHVQITGEDVAWFKFVAPSDGTYTFYTEGGSDTTGQIFSQLFEYSKHLLATDKDSGDASNFKITLNLQKNQCVYIRVEPETLIKYYNMCVKQE